MTVLLSCAQNGGAHAGAFIDVVAQCIQVLGRHAGENLLFGEILAANDKVIGLRKRHGSGEYDTGHKT
ncbi:hypothetical protein [Halomonas sp.]|uniref:hypothetical protein n=1 Tax=Halomonas sp. TaxID=1486246 RepID=UPI00338FB877